MVNHAAPTPPSVRSELNRLILRRTRVALGLSLASVLAFMTANHLWWSSPPLWTDVMNGAVAALIMVAFAATRLRVVAGHPAPFALLVFSGGCALRSLAGVWHGDVAPTAMLLVDLALVTAATLPWGVLPQITLTAIAGSAIAVNSYLVAGNFGPPPGHASASVALALVVSVVLAIELQRYRVQILVDNFRRRQAEEHLAELNAALECRVQERTAQLDAAVARVEREARERRQTTRELRESEKRMQDILDNAPAAIHLKDAAGRYLLVNHHWETIAGQRRADVIGKTAHDFQRFEIAEALRSNDLKVLAARHPLQFEEVVPVGGTPRVFLSVKFPLLDSSGAPVAVCGISTDITERKQAEEAARAHQAELAHVLRLGTMGEMAAGLAHEINQPLGAIANYAQGCVLRLRAGSVDAPALLPIVEAIAAQALRAGGIIRSLRTLVRKDTTWQQPADLNRLVREAVRIVENDAQQHSVDVHLDLAPELPPLLCNGTQIEQVLINLLLNSIDAVGAARNGNRRVVVTTAPRSDGGFEVTVSDSGIGLPAEDVFAPFFTTKSHGLGMGLSISRSIVEAHGGRLWATPNPDCGSTFHVTLPARTADGSDEVTSSTPEH